MKKTIAVIPAKTVLTKEEADRLRWGAIESNLLDFHLKFQATRYPIHFGASLFGLYGIRIEPGQLLNSSQQNLDQLEDFCHLLKVMHGREPSSYDLGASRGLVFGQGDFRRIILRKIPDTGLWVITNDDTSPSHKPQTYANDSTRVLDKVREVGFDFSVDCIEIPEQPQALAAPTRPIYPLKLPKYDPRLAGDIRFSDSKKNPESEQFKHFFSEKFKETPWAEGKRLVELFEDMVKDLVPAQTYQIKSIDKIVASNKNLRAYLQIAAEAFQEAFKIENTERENNSVCMALCDALFCGNPLVFQDDQGRLSLNETCFKQEEFLDWFQSESGIPDHLKLWEKQLTLSPDLRQLLGTIQKTVATATDSLKKIKLEAEKALALQAIEHILSKTEALSQADIKAFFQKTCEFPPADTVQRELFLRLIAKLPPAERCALEEDQCQVLASAVSSSKKSQPELALKLLLALPSSAVTQAQFSRLVRIAISVPISLDDRHTIFRLSLEVSPTTEQLNCTLGSDIAWRVVSPLLVEGQLDLALLIRLSHFFYRFATEHELLPREDWVALCPDLPRDRADLNHFIYDALTAPIHPTNHFLSPIPHSADFQLSPSQHLPGCFGSEQESSKLGFWEDYAQKNPLPALSPEIDQSLALTSFAFRLREEVLRHHCDQRLEQEHTQFNAMHLRSGTIQSKRQNEFVSVPSLQELMSASHPVQFHASASTDVFQELRCFSHSIARDSTLFLRRNQDGSANLFFSPSDRSTPIKIHGATVALFIHSLPQTIRTMQDAIRNFVSRYPIELGTHTEKYRFIVQFYAELLPELATTAYRSIFPTATDLLGSTTPHLVVLSGYGIYEYVPRPKTLPNQFISDLHRLMTRFATASHLDQDKLRRMDTALLFLLTLPDQLKIIEAWGDITTPLVSNLTIGTILRDINIFSSAENIQVKINPLSLPTL